MIYFVRVNGETSHNDPSQPLCYVPGEPPQFPEVAFNYVAYCLREGIVRIGWPDTGDLTRSSKTGAIAQCYDLTTLPPHIQDYLRQFRAIPQGARVLMPDKSSPGVLYIGKVSRPYHYQHNPPSEPYECAHRLGVDWYRDGTRPTVYDARTLGISIHGDFWPLAFADITNHRCAPKIP